MNCGVCTTAGCTDNKEPNDFALSAKSLGDATDAPNTTMVVRDLTMSDGDEDWFKMRTSDSGFGGNPQINVSVSVNGAEVSVFHDCDSKPNYSTCTTNQGTTVNDPSLGAGCVSASSGTSGGKTSLATECSGITETGTTYIRVRKMASNGQCTPYTLTIEVF